MSSKQPSPAIAPIAVGSITSPRGRGGPPGKHSNPDYTQATAYVRSEVHDAVQLKLWQLKIAKKQKKGKKLEYSELVEELLVEWLERQGYKIEKA